MLHIIVKYFLKLH